MSAYRYKFESIWVPLSYECAFFQARFVDCDGNMSTVGHACIGPVSAAYVITLLHSNAVILTWSFYDGNILFDGTVPVTGATGTYYASIYSYYHSFSLFVRSANITASLPYSVGNFQGTVVGAEKQLYRSGLLDSSFRLSVNLMGGPSMAPQKFAKWQQKILLGASLNVVAPTGQYDPTKLINWAPTAVASNRSCAIPNTGPFVARWLHGGVVLHDQSRVPFTQCLLSRHAGPIAEPGRFLRGSRELQCQASALVLCRRELPVRRHNKCERCTKSADCSEELAHRRNSLNSYQQAPVF